MGTFLYFSLSISKGGMTSVMSLWEGQAFYAGKELDTTIILSTLLLRSNRQRTTLHSNLVVYLTL